MFIWLSIFILLQFYCLIILDEKIDITNLTCDNYKVCKEKILHHLECMDYGLSKHEQPSLLPTSGPNNWMSGEI